MVSDNNPSFKPVDVQPKVDKNESTKSSQSSTDKELQKQPAKPQRKISTSKSSAPQEKSSGDNSSGSGGGGGSTASSGASGKDTNDSGDEKKTNDVATKKKSTSDGDENGGSDGGSTTKSSGEDKGQKKERFVSFSKKRQKANETLPHNSKALDFFSLPSTHDSNICANSWLKSESLRKRTRCCS